MKRDSFICKRCLDDVLKTWDRGRGSSKFVDRRLDNGFCIYNVLPNGELDLTLGEATRDVPVKCEYACEQAVSQVGEEEVNAKAKKEWDTAYAHAMTEANRLGWKVTIVAEDANRRVTFMKGEDRIEFMYTGLREFFPDELSRLRAVSWEMTSRWYRETSNKKTE